MAVTLKDVARRAGVSYATVSRVLAGKPNIRDETRRTVLAAVDDLGYTPNRTARSLQARKSQIIGVIVSDIRYDFFPPVVRGIEHVVSQQGYGIFLSNSDEDHAKEERFARLLLEENVSGAIIAPTGLESTSIRNLEEAGIPVVTFDRHVRSPETDSVTIDNFESARRLTGHLLERGYRRIGAAFGRSNATTATERLRGFLAALDEAGIDPDPSLVRVGGPSREDGILHTRSLLQRSDPPEAIFASNHLLATGVYEVLREMRLRIPEDVALVSFDDPPWASYVEPPITVVSQPTFDIGRTAATLLLERIAAPRAPRRHVTLPAELLVRGSSVPRSPAGEARHEAGPEGGQGSPVPHT